MHAQTPDLIYVGLARALGFDPKLETAPNSHRFILPETTLGALAADLKKRIGSKALRVVGDPGARVSRVQIGVGYATPSANGDIDVVVSGEQQETDGAFDSPGVCDGRGVAGNRKGLDHAGSRDFRRAWHGRSGGMDSRVRDGKSPVQLHPADGRTVLESTMITAGDVLDRIKKNLGVPWQENTTRDTFKAGGPATEVKGIATTVMSTFDQIKRAHAEGLNFILTHETTYWYDRDLLDGLADDPVYRAKSEFCAANNIVILRFHDNLHARRPDFTFQALARVTGWTQYEDPPNSRRFLLPETTLGALAADVAKRLGSKALRIVGDPAAKVSRTQMGVGYGMPRAAGDVDVVMSGEAQETDGAVDNTEYVMDAATLGVPKGQIILGHAISEEPGMEDCAEWLRSFITEIPVKLVRAGEPYWPK